MKSRVGYRPLPGGLAQVDAALVERSLLFQGAPELIGVAVDAVFEQEISMKLSSPTGGGELWTASWRWWEQRPRVSLSLAVPHMAGFRGVWQMEGFWEQQSYSISRLSVRRTVRQITRWYKRSAGGSRSRSAIGRALIHGGN